MYKERHSCPYCMRDFKNEGDLLSHVKNCILKKTIPTGPDSTNDCKCLNVKRIKQKLMSLCFCKRSG